MSIFVGLCASQVFAEDTHLLVITGVSGDEEHAKAFHTWATKLMDAAVNKEGVPAANVIYLAEKTEVDPGRVKGRSTKENVEKVIGDIVATAHPNDPVFIVLIGHGTFDGKQAAFNLPGPDLSAADWTKLLGKLADQRVVFVNTASASGAFLAAVAGPGRTIVTATKTGGERNETRFPEFFVEAFGDESADLDRNGHVSVLEAFNYAKSKVVKAFEQGGLLLTEHAALDDGNEGRMAGTAFLTTRPTETALKVDVSDPELRALADERDAIQKDLDGLKLRKDSMDPARYDQELEKLLTELALKTKAIRDLQAKKGGK